MNEATIFFNTLLRDIKKRSEIKLILVTHLLPDRPNFIQALEKVMEIGLIIPKPKTIQPDVLNQLKKYPIFQITRDKLKQKDIAIKLIRKYVGDSPFIIADIGGYFAAPALDIKKEFKDRFLGIVEDTENGFQKYLTLKENLSFPVYSVARSPLKLPEDTLVGYSTVFSAETILREKGEVLNGQRAVVFGYGKIGSCIAKDLTRKQVRVKIYDIDPVKMVQACSEGYHIISREEALEDIDLIFAVTGNKCLAEEDLIKINKDVYIFSITSSDDEFEFNGFNGFNVMEVDNHLIINNGKACINIVNKGNAVNFLHKAVVGNFIYLIQGEILYGILELLKEKKPYEFLTVDINKESHISQTWLKVFN